MIRTILIDDEEHVRENLKQILTSNFKNIEIVGEGNSVDSAIQIIKETAPDLVFLDIDLSDGSGFTVLDNINSINFKVIFVTAFNEHAIKAFQYNALDYILKPIDVDLLQVAISKVKDKATKELITRNEVKELIENLSRTESDKKLILKDKEYNYYIRVGDIMRCEADGNYTTIYCTEQDKIVVSYPLKKYVSMLPESLFFRVHQSNLINLAFVKKVLKEDSGIVVMNDGSKIPIARRRKEAFFEALEQSIS